MPMTTVPEYQRPRFPALARNLLHLNCLHVNEGGRSNHMGSRSHILACVAVALTAAACNTDTLLDACQAACDKEAVCSPGLSPEARAECTQACGLFAELCPNPGTTALLIEDCNAAMCSEFISCFEDALLGCGVPRGRAPSPDASIGDGGVGNGTPPR